MTCFLLIFKHYFNRQNIFSMHLQKSKLYLFRTSVLLFIILFFSLLFTLDRGSKGKWSNIECNLCWSTVPSGMDEASTFHSRLCGHFTCYQHRESQFSKWFDGEKIAVHLLNIGILNDEILKIFGKLVNSVESFFKWSANWQLHQHLC